MTAIPNQMDRFRAGIEGISERALRRTYPDEVTIHARILRDAKAGRCKVHDEFRRFASFIRHVGPREDPTRSLDRIDNTDPEYGPGKVRWATPREQANNRSTTRHLRSADGRVLPLTVWAEITKQSADTMRTRLRRGWTEEEVVAGRRGVASASPQVEGAPPAEPPVEVPPLDDDPWHERISAEAREALAVGYAAFLRVVPGGTRALFTLWWSGHAMRVAARLTTGDSPEQQQAFRRTHERVGIIREDARQAVLGDTRLAYIHGGCREKLLESEKAMHRHPALEPVIRATEAEIDRRRKAGWEAARRAAEARRRWEIENHPWKRPRRAPWDGEDQHQSQG